MDAGTYVAIIVLIVLIVLQTVKCVLDVIDPEEFRRNFESDDRAKEYKKLTGLAKFHKFMKTLLWPFEMIFRGLARFVLLLVHIRRDNPENDVTEDAIISIVNEGHENGVLESEEAAMINNIIDFADKEAGEIMVNRSNIEAIDKDMGIQDALKFMLKNSYSRYPVYDQNLDKIIGLLYLKDVSRLLTGEVNADTPVIEFKKLIRKALFVLETTNISDLFKQMQSEKRQVAIVIDEYGQTRGLVTMEDILEEIVGNILDEFDEEEKHIRKSGKDCYIIDGFTSLDEVESKLGIHFNITEFETLNGFMISKLDRLPEPNEEFATEYEGYEFEVAEVSNRMVTKIKVTKLVENKDEDIKKEEDK